MSVESLIGKLKIGSIKRGSGVACKTPMVTGNSWFNNDVENEIYSWIYWRVIYIRELRVYVFRSY